MPVVGVNVRSVQGPPHALALVPVAGRVRLAFVEQVCVKLSPSHTVEGAGVQLPAQVGGGGGQPVRVPVAGRVSEEWDRHVCVKLRPSQMVEDAGPQPPGQTHAGLVVSVPTAGRVSVASVEQVWVNVVPLHAVDGAGPQLPPHVGGGGLPEQPGVVSVPTAFCVAPLHRFVCVYETPSQMVDGSGSQCAARFEKHAGRPQDVPAITSPAASVGHISAPHSHASVAHGQPPPAASSTQWSPRRFVCSPVGDAVTYRRCVVLSDSNRYRQAAVISPRPAAFSCSAQFRYERNSVAEPRKMGLKSLPGTIW